MNGQPLGLKYWLLKHMNGLDIDIINYIKLYCQIKLFNAPIYQALSDGVSIKHFNQYLIKVNDMVYQGYILPYCLNDLLHVETDVIVSNHIVSIKFYYRKKGTTMCFSIHLEKSLINPRYIKLYNITQYKINYCILPTGKYEMIQFENFNKDGLYIFKENVSFVYDPNQIMD